MSKKVLILPGDGIGQEVTSSAIQILEFIVDKFNLDFSTKILDVGGTAYEKFGSPIPEDVLVSAKEADAIIPVAKMLNGIAFFKYLIIISSIGSVKFSI